MATLQQLKKHIELGERVELSLLHPRINKNGEDIEIGVCIGIWANAHGYTWLLENVLHVNNEEIKTILHEYPFESTWEDFLKRIEGIQTTSNDWTIVQN